LIETLRQQHEVSLYTFDTALSGPHRVLYYWHYLGNTVLTTLSNMFTNLNLTDMETCYKVFTRSAIDSIWPTLKQNRFGIEPERTRLTGAAPPS
jgi:hypothetical protein